MDNIFSFDPVEGVLGLFAFCASGFMVAGFLGFARFIIFGFMENSGLPKRRGG